MQRQSRFHLHIHFPSNTVPPSTSLPREQHLPQSCLDSPFSQLWTPLGQLINDQMALYCPYGSSYPGPGTIKLTVAQGLPGNPNSPVIPKVFLWLVFLWLSWGSILWCLGIKDHAVAAFMQVFKQCSSRPSCPPVCRFPGHPVAACVYRRAKVTLRTSSALLVKLTCFFEILKKTTHLKHNSPVSGVVTELCSHHHHLLSEHFHHPKKESSH